MNPNPLPFSDDCEKALLSCFVRSADTRREVFPYLPSTVFYVPANRILYDAFTAIGGEDGPLDFLLAKKWLIETNRLEEIGGLEALSFIWSFVPTSANWRHYLKIVKECFQRRHVILQARALIEEMQDEQLEFESGLSEHVEQILTKLVVDVPKVEKAFRTYAIEAMEDIEARTQNPGIIGARFGIPVLDNEIEGFRPGEYAVICAETSGGKSALALGLLINESKRGNHVALFSLEMSGKQILERAFSLEGRVSMKRLRSGYLMEHDFPRLTSAVDTVSKLPIHLEESYSMTIDQIVSRCRILKVKYDIQLVCIDYLQLLGASRTEDNREREVAGISRKLRLLALELKISVVALSQLNDKGKIRESRAISHDADNVLKICDSDSDDVYAREIVMDKNRNGARGATIKLNFHGEYMRFEQPAN